MTLNYHKIWWTNFALNLILQELLMVSETVIKHFKEFKNRHATIVKHNKNVKNILWPKLFLRNKSQKCFLRLKLERVFHQVSKNINLWWCINETRLSLVFRDWDNGANSIAFFFLSVFSVISILMCSIAAFRRSLKHTLVYRFRWQYSVK